MCHLRQHLGFLLVQDNMAMMCSRMPTLAPPGVDGDADRDESPTPSWCWFSPFL